MKRVETRRTFLHEIGAISLTTVTGSIISTSSLGVPISKEDKPAGIKSLSPRDIFTVLDLDKRELAEVKTAFKKKGHHAALTALLAYYRERYPKSSKSEDPENGDATTCLERANNLEKHIFQWGPYTPFPCGENIDWAADPAGDVEWIANLHRFYWVNDLGKAYEITGDDRYVKVFIELTADWIQKHPLEKTMNIVHPVYEWWKGYPWLDLQTGIRATNICRNFRILIHSKSFTPPFLGILLASLYDHQIKTEKLPMGKIHNKAIFEQRGFFNVLHTFPEFKQTKSWLNTAINITCENLLAQTTHDGVQREWCGGYHWSVYNDVLEIDGRVRDLGSEMPDYYVSRIKGMADYMFGISTPDLGFPMFGDTGRRKPESDNRKTWQLHDTMVEAGKRFGDSKYQALADLDIAGLPKNGSAAFPGAGFYAMRNEWTPDQIYLALHCSPPSLNPWHDQPDNGAFELYAYGRWLMPDSGFYTYGHDQNARDWHRQTKVHPTLTLNGKDTETIGRQLLWKSDEKEDIACVENQSYKSLQHRRTIWFAGKSSEMPFFVILDEAIGDSKGKLELHYPLAPGPVSINRESQAINTMYEDVNLMILVKGKVPFTLNKEEGWTANEYGKRERRSSVTATYLGSAPASFISILVPYKGKTAPEGRLLTNPVSIIAGKDPIEIQIELAGRQYILQRKL